MKRNTVILTVLCLSAAMLSVTSIPTVAQNEQFESACDETPNSLNERFEDAREETLNSLNERFEDAREEILNS
jgi:7-cyano-7-deazaguanine synthase in queuosine biosynthesis